MTIRRQQERNRIDAVIALAGATALVMVVVVATAGDFTRGGAVFSSLGLTEIEATTFIRNACRMGAHSQTPDASRPYGGAAYLASGAMVLRNSLMAENTLASVRNPDHRAGGLYVEGGSATIVNSTIASNTLHGVERSAGTVSIRNSILFFNNSSGVQIAGTVTATFSDIVRPRGTSLSARCGVPGRERL